MIKHYKRSFTSVKIRGQECSYPQHFLFPQQLLRPPFLLGQSPQPQCLFRLRPSDQIRRATDWITLESRLSSSRLEYPRQSGRRVPWLVLIFKGVQILFGQKGRHLAHGRSIPEHKARQCQLTQVLSEGFELSEGLYNRGARLFQCLPRGFLLFFSPFLFFLQGWPENW